ncbi:MAG: hypothetical protein ACRC62_19725 [Microcoleus sp.]
MKNTAESRSPAKHQTSIHDIIDQSGIAAIVRPIANQSSYLIDFQCELPTFKWGAIAR